MKLAKKGGGFLACLSVVSVLLTPVFSVQFFPAVGAAIALFWLRSFISVGYEIHKLSP